MLKLDKIQDTYPWDIVVKIPNNGSYDKWTVKVLYKRLPHEERMALLDQMMHLSDDEEMSNAERLVKLNGYQDELFEKVFAGWEKGQIVNEDGDLEPDATGRATMLEITEFRNALFDGYQKSNGGDKVAEGNS